MLPQKSVPISVQRVRRQRKPGDMPARELRSTLKDYYAFHDPFKTEADIDNIIAWTKKKGIMRLNEKLRSKYGEDLEVRGEELSKRTRVLSKLITPGLVEAYQQDDYDIEEDDAFSSVSNNHGRPAVRERTSSIIHDPQKKKAVEEAIEDIEYSQTPKEIRKNLMTFYGIVAPQRLELAGEEPPFVEEILTWTFRFGLAALVNNLRVKYLGYEEQDYDAFGQESTRSRSVATQQRSALKPVIDVVEVPQPNLNKNIEEPPKELMQEEVVYSPMDLSPSEEALVAEKIREFYQYHNPSRVANGVDELVEYVKKRGIEALNHKLKGRYNEDLNTFNKGPMTVQKFDQKLNLFERLFDFYSKNDPTKVGGGLSRIISWTERNGYDALQQQLRDQYGGKDLDSP